MSPRLVNAITIGAVALAVAAVYLIFYMPDSVTYGQITLSSPEVFTRERLVNDRYQQDAWLRIQLDTPIECAPNATVSLEKGLAAELRVNESSNPATSDPPQQQPLTSRESSPQTSPKPLDRDCFEQALDFREQIRSLLIENQLDDRHDLNGTSLFKLKFDVAVVPGRNTEALATIRVTVSGGERGFDQMTAHAAGRVVNPRKTPPASTKCPERAEDIDLTAWEPIYAEWIENIEKRLNQTQKEQRQRYESNALGRSDYLDLIGYLRTQSKVDEHASLPGCKVASTVELEKVSPLPVETSEHNSWKQCLRLIANPKRPSTTRYSSTEQYVVQYGDAVHAPRKPDDRTDNSKLQSAQQYALPQLEEDPEGIAQANLDSKLNEYFAKRSVLLVLGIDEPLSTSANRPREPGSVFSRLLKLSFVNQSSAIPIGNFQATSTSFAVLPRTYHLVAIDKTRFNEARYEEVTSIDTQVDKSANIANVRAPQDWLKFLPRTRFREFRVRCGLKTEQGTDLALWDEDVHITQVGLAEVTDELKDYPINPEDIQSTSEPGVYLVRVRTGLYNFVSQLKNHGQPYTYAVAPQENGMMLHLEQRSSRQLDVGAQGGGGINAKGKMSSLARVGTEETQDIASIIGFGESDQDGKARFAWVINPRDRQLDNKGRLIYRQSLKKYAVSALVSVPSWWRSLSVSTTTSWRDSAGKDHRVTDASPVHIEIPSDFEAFEATLLGLQGPELDGSALDPIRLVAGKVPQQILIPGRRLWRSTEVTLGDQPADSIEVLPNMKGIIAKFTKISDSSTPDEKSYRCDKHKNRNDVEIRRTVRVWTSQGAVTLPQPATIYVLEKC